MFKRISSSAAFAAFIFAMIGLFPVVATAQAPDEPQQGAINTSRSNIKNTSRTTGAGLVLVVDLNQASGEKVASDRLVDTNNDGTLSAAESAFGFDVVPKGDYVLTLRSVDGKIESVKSDLTARVTVTAAGRKIENDWKLETNKAADASREDPTVGLVYASRVNVLRIPITSDGKLSIAGKVMLPNGAVIVNSIGKPL